MNKMEVDLTLKDIVDFLYPIGSLYYTQDSSFNPNTHFGGTWVQIKDKFILACGETYKINQTGGEASFSLSVNELPHEVIRVCKNESGAMQEISASSWGGQTVPNGGWSATDYSFSTRLNPNAKSQPHNNMPPYETAFIWKRTGE